ncbi:MULTISPECIES: GNAT family N-acetyltransferase [unclassified Amycolatopsis]|uniref:GNAT family N-acetyltransferase n=1 Tax=unclassified Amycolatopsis TaxID=2618356 RepID=UPI001EE78FBD|nr:MULTISPECIES: GNAT family N-acetyltransferase [unclassified Amycolatopsis]
MTVVLPIPRTTLRLRPWRSEDRQALVDAHRDPLLRRRLTTSLANDAEAQRWLDAQASGWDSATQFSFAVAAVDDTPVGHVVVKVRDEGAAEVGYWTAAQARGRGIAAQALEVTSRWALDTQQIVRVDRLDLLHAEDNPASCRVAEKCRYMLAELLPPAPPDFPARGHRHVRTSGC